MLKYMTVDDIRQSMKDKKVNFQMNWNNEKYDMAMFCWWNFNLPEAITDALGEMTKMFHNDIKEISNFMDVRSSFE